jgi:hypothetical protein
MLYFKTIGIFFIKSIMNWLLVFKQHIYLIAIRIFNIIIKILLVYKSNLFILRDSFPIDIEK